MDPVQTQVEQGLLSRLPHDLLHLFRHPLHRFLDPGGMDPSVLDQTRERDPGDLPADGVKPRQDDGFRGVVDDDVDPRGRLERTDVPPFPPDDPALHLLGGERNRRHDTLGDVVGRVPLDGQRDHLLRLLARLLLVLLVDRTDLLPGLHLGVVHDHFHEFVLRLLGGHSRDPLEVFFPLADHLLKLRVSPLEPLLLLGELPLLFSEFQRPGFQGLRLPVESVLLLQKALLELADLVLPITGLPLEIQLHLELVVLGLKRSLLEGVLGLLSRALKDLLGLGRRFPGTVLRDLLLRQQREHQERKPSHQKRKGNDDDHDWFQRVPPFYRIYFMPRPTTPSSVTTASTGTSHASTGTSGTICQEKASPTANDVPPSPLRKRS